jgi:hypothetical protein
MFPGFGKFLIFVGIALVVIGAFLTWGPNIPWLGRLPGDIIVKRDNFSFYFPIATCLLLSVILTLILYLFRR